MRFGIAILRAVIGGLFVGHGLQKLTGAFGGYGLEGTAGGFEQMGLRPGKVHATAAGVAETAGGGLLLAGLATPLAASALTGTMAVAIKKVHIDKGPWAANGGYEYNAVLMAALFAISADGPGSPSLDEAFGTTRNGLRWGLLELAAGLGGALAMLKFADQGAPAETSASGSSGAGSESTPEPATA
jgi:putative oxidoreductase